MSSLLFRCIIYAPLFPSRRKSKENFQFSGQEEAMHVRKIWPRLFDRLCGRPLHFIDPTFAEPSPSLLDSWPLCAVKRIASASGAEGYRACRLGCGPETMVDSDVSLRRQRGMLSSPVSPSCRGTTSLLISKRFRADSKGCDIFFNSSFSIREI